MLTENEVLLAETSDILAESRIVYLILYANDLVESRTFYEQKLGLRLIEADENSVKFDAGLVILALYRASDYGIELVGRRDDASDVVFMVDDINTMRQALESRGVVFSRRRTYEVGLVTDFYDPNGHRLMLYQPSAEVLTWPSGDKLRQVWRACGKGGASLIGPAAVPLSENGQDIEVSGLDGKPLIYLFMFVPDSDDALAFYKGVLGLRVLESVPCDNPTCPRQELGIVKYDGGGMLLSTHHVHKSPVIKDFGIVYSPPVVDPTQMKGIVPVFHVTGLERVVERLSSKGVDFSLVAESQIGDIARFEASTGHTFYLYEPSARALMWPAGAKIEQILAV